jgi:endoglucanase
LPVSKESAQKVFNQLLQNIRLENCQFYPEVVNAIFRRVPARIEAENYDHEGPGKSYSIRGAAQNAKYYRTSEPVPVSLIDTGGRRGGQAIQLNAEEWTSYSFTSLSAQRYQLKLRVRPVSTPAAFKVSVGPFTREISVTEPGWAEVAAGAVDLPGGESQLKFAVTQGELEFDWLSFAADQHPPESPQASRPSYE